MTKMIRKIISIPVRIVLLFLFTAIVLPEIQAQEQKLGRSTGQYPQGRAAADALPARRGHTPREMVW
jgi:hypothetical protein